MSENKERIKTMPQGDSRIPTMSQQDMRIPTMPQGDVRIPTMPQSSQGRIATVPQTDANGRVATVPQGKNGNMVNYGQSGSIIVKEDITFTGDKDGKYTIDAKNIISKDSGESQIYGCTKENDKNKYVARVLISVTPDSEIEKITRRKKVIKFLDNASTNFKSHILPLIDHSKININNKEYYVEIYPYCEGGDLGTRKGKIKYKEIQEEIVPAINSALKEFHDAGLVHRDVKPENLYKYDGKIVLGDFGITCDLREDGFATDKYKTGTLGYYAPELMSQAAIKASDYYSFGQTIWTLYSGEMMYQNIIRRYNDYGIEEQRNQVNYAMLNNVYYGLEEIKKEDSFFEILVKGLLKYDPSSRYDYETVNRWIQGDKSLIKSDSKHDNAAEFNTPFRYNGVEYWTNVEIYNILVANWENAKELLYSGALKEFYKNNDYGIASEIDRIVKGYSTLPKKNGKNASEEEIDLINDVGMSRFFFVLNRGSALVWRNEQYTSFSDISTQIGSVIDGDNIYLQSDYSDLLSSELLGYWYELITADNGGHDKAMADAISDIYLYASFNDYFENKVAYATAYYLFMDNEENIFYRDCHSIDDIANMIIKYDKNIYSFIKEMMSSPLFYGFLYAQGYYSSVNYMLKNAHINDYDDLEMFFDLLFNNVEDTNILSELRKIYVDKGPNAYLVWWKNNLNLYEFKGSEAAKLRKQIEDIDVVGENIEEIRNKINELNNLSIRFRKMFVDNIFLRKMGLNKGTKDITSDNMDAYWHYDFLDREVPLGFGKYIGSMEV